MDQVPDSNNNCYRICSYLIGCGDSKVRKIAVFKSHFYFLDGCMWSWLTALYSVTAGGGGGGRSFFFRAVAGGRMDCNTNQWKPRSLILDMCLPLKIFFSECSFRQGQFLPSHFSIPKSKRFLMLPHHPLAKGYCLPFSTCSFLLVITSCRCFFRIKNKVQ